MKSSIRVKLALMFMIFIAGALIVLYTINVFFLGSFYRYTKERTLMEIYDKINTGYNNIDENEIIRLCQSSGISLLITDESGEVVFNHGSSEVLSNRLQDMIFGIEDDETQVIENTGSYTLQTSVDNITSSQYIEMWGIFEDNSYFIMQMTYESMQESATISSKFLAYMGIIVMNVSFIIMFVVSKTFTKPILELASISKRMTNLDFDVKYNGDRDDEIGVLGDSINEMSIKLERTINELKKANIELEKDLENKTKSDEMRKEFLSNVSHELKTPITLISGYAEGLKESIHESPESKDYYCEVIIDEAEKMNVIVQKLLTLNQIEFGNNHVNIERFDIVKLIKQVLKSSQILIKKSDLKVEFNNNSQMFVWADKYQTEEILINYISNAINHTDNKKLIRIEVHSSKGTTRISVYNSGEHIPDEDKDKIWEKFYKVDKARTREYGGSGIGLSIVKAIVQSLGKECGVENVEGGVEFWFELDSQAYKNNK